MYQAFTPLCKQFAESFSYCESGESLEGGVVLDLLGEGIIALTWAAPKCLEMSEQVTGGEIKKTEDVGK